jgi:hypothetical protein
MQTTPLLFLACLFLSGCSPSSSPKHPPTQEESFAFVDGTTMQVRERTGESVRGIHIVRKTSDGGVETTDAETGRISEGTDKQVMRVTLYDAHVDRGQKGRLTAEQLTMDLPKKPDQESLEKISRDLRSQRPTNQIQPTGR